MIIALIITVVWLISWAICVSLILSAKTDISREDDIVIIAGAGMLLFIGAPFLLPFLILARVYVFLIDKKYHSIKKWK